jgi:hypothetical protein
MFVRAACLYTMLTLRSHRAHLAGSSLIEATLNIGDTMLSQHQGVQGTQWVAQRDGTSLPVSSHQSAGGFQRGGLGGAAASPQAPSPQQRPSAMHQTHHVRTRPRVSLQGLGGGS